METTYIIEDVTVTNIDKVTTKLDELITKTDTLASYVINMEIWLQIIVYCIFLGIAYYITNWLWKTWIRGLVRQYFKLNLF